MIKKLNKIWINKKGTALLTALLVMGILVSVSIAISTLVIREIVTTRLALDSAKAYYAAESGVELALLKLKYQLPGYAESDVGISVGDGEGIYTILNRAQTYPYFDDKEYDFASDTAKVDPSALYAVLGLNESITVPLFTVDKDGNEAKIEKFVVQYYTKFNADDFQDKKVDGETFSGWDILRWKIYGMKGDAASDSGGKTESINDFTAVTTFGGILTNDASPSWFGSFNCDNDQDLQGTQAGINCKGYDPVPPSSGSTIVTVDIDDKQYEQIVYDKICSPTDAREFYKYENDGSSTVQACWPINSFIEYHKYNYLTLTNFMNPNVFKEAYTWADRLEKSKLYFRIVSYDEPLVREYADIVSTGKSGDSEITLNVKKKRGSTLPVLNFALYHTKPDSPKRSAE